MKSTTKVFWLTGLSGAGKTTTAEALTSFLRAQGERVCLLDGDVLRRGLCRDLGFSEADRVENIRRTGEVVRLFHNTGVHVVAAFISPLQKGREAVRALLPAGDFFEIYINTPLSECERRDPKGLYKRARQGEIKDFTGISSPYEPPLTPEVVLDTSHTSVELCVEQIIRKAGLL